MREARREPSGIGRNLRRLSQLSWFAGRREDMERRLAAALVIAWGLLRAAPWAWWVGLALATLWLVAGLAPVLVTERGDVQWLQPSGDQIFLAAGLVGLAVALILLLTPSARRFLRDGRD